VTLPGSDPAFRSGLKIQNIGVFDIFVALDLGRGGCSVPWVGFDSD